MVSNVLDWRDAIAWSELSWTLELVDYEISEAVRLKYDHEYWLASVRKQVLQDAMMLEYGLN